VLFLHENLYSKYTFYFITGQSILAKLASSEENKDVLIDLLSKDVYKSLVETLFLPDISVS